MKACKLKIYAAKILILVSSAILSAAASGQTAGYDFAMNTLNNQYNYLQNTMNVQTQSVLEQQRIGQEEYFLRAKLQQNDLPGYTAGTYEIALHHFGYQAQAVRHRATDRQIALAGQFHATANVQQRNYLNAMFMEVVRAQQSTSAARRSVAAVVAQQPASTARRAVIIDLDGTALQPPKQPSIGSSSYGQHAINNFRPSTNVVDMRGVQQIPAHFPWNGRVTVPPAEAAQWDNNQR